MRPGTKAHAVWTIVATGLFVGVNSACGTTAKDLIFGGISSGGDKPSDQRPHIGPEGTAPSSGDSNASPDAPRGGKGDKHDEGSLTPAAETCGDEAKLDGLRFDVDVAPDAEGCALRADHGIHCLTSLTFEPDGFVRLRFVGPEDQEGVLRSYAQCGSRIYVALDKGDGEGLAVEELMTDEGATTLRVEATGRGYTRQL